MFSHTCMHLNLGLKPQRVMAYNHNQLDKMVSLPSFTPTIIFLEKKNNCLYKTSPQPFILSLLYYSLKLDPASSPRAVPHTHTLMGLRTVGISPSPFSLLSPSPPLPNPVYSARHPYFSIRISLY